MGWAQQLRDEGRQEGIEQGLRRGQQALLERQLERRFGPLSETARQTLAAADAETLGVWGERLLEAASLEDVFASGAAP